MDILEVVHDTALNLINDAGMMSSCNPASLKCDSFIARSAMQKAIRRGDSRIALRAAAALFPNNRAVLWRRLIVTALEDLGILEFRNLLQIAGGVEGHRIGLPIGNEWAIISNVIEGCCDGARCQAANDLHNLAVNALDYEHYRIDAARLSPHDLLSHASDEQRDLVERYIAALTSLGEDHAPWTRKRRACEPELLAAALGQRLNPSVVTVYTWAYRKTRVPLAWGSLLLLAANGGVMPATLTFDDDVPHAPWIDEVPSFALDQYTRAGKAALRSFAASNQKWKHFVEPHSFSISKQHSAAGELLFRVEGAVVTRRADWDIARTLYDQSRHIGCYLPESAVEEGFTLIRSELPSINEARQIALRMMCS
jgi:hypothetical protein